jgi:30S ribosome assembly GTPase
MAQTCTGCGATLQSQELDAPGYVPESAMGKPHPLCRRCYRIRHYGEFSRVALPLSRYAKEVSAVMQKPGLVLYVLDVFDLSGSMVPHLFEYIGNSPVIAVVNKVDLLPQEVSPHLLRNWISETLMEAGIRPVDVCFVSAEKGMGFEELEAAIALRREPRIYAVGMANVGKSSILNALAKRLESEPPFTESRVPGTTLANTHVEMMFGGQRKKTVIDTPGLILKQRITDVLCNDCLKVVIPSSRLRPRIYQLQPGQTVFLGGLARLDFDSGQPQSFVFYVSNDVVVHRTKLERAEDFVRLHSDDILKCPCDTCRDALGPWNSTAVRAGIGIPRSALKVERNEIAIGPHGGDIVVPGLGWIALSGAPFGGTIWSRSSVQMDVRDRLIGSLARH